MWVGTHVGGAKNNTIWLSGVPRGSILVSFMFYHSAKNMVYFMHKKINNKKIKKWVGLGLARPPRGYAPGVDAFSTN